MVTHDGAPLADQAHPDPIDTDTLPLPPDSPTVVLDGDSVGLQFGAPSVLCEIMKEIPATPQEWFRLAPEILAATV